MEKRNLYSIGFLLIISTMFLSFYWGKKREEAVKLDTESAAILTETALPSKVPSITPVNAMKESDGSTNENRQMGQGSEEAAAVEDVKEEDRQRMGVVATKALNVRRTPKKDAAVIQILEKDTRVVILDQSEDGWFQIEFDEEIGYAYSEYIREVTE